MDSPSPAQNSVAQNLTRVEEQIAASCAAAGRTPDEVRLLPVSKTHPMDAVRQVAAFGYRTFGENKVQELVAKCAERGAGEQIGFAVIGHLQSNKAKQVAELAAEFHALDSLHLATELERRLAAAGRTLPVYLQVNSSGEPQKSGVALDELDSLVDSLQGLDHLDVRGLMTLAMRSDEERQVAACFERTRQARDRLRDRGALGVAWDELSMGMSGDFALAIREGATTVRVGTAIFGARDYSARA